MSKDIWERTLTTRVAYKWAYHWRSNRLMSVGDVYRITEWCDQNCRDEWQANIQQQEWRFDSERDYIMFALKWSDK